jgi:hypothetical protein
MITSDEDFHVSESLAQLVKYSLGVKMFGTKVVKKN